ncbi:SDR family oxidoreductase [Gandjariella thermophila]|uniref:Nucleotide-diphosphate-sugar epimerase n=1 Tax=Gandjariella thermophila TaxID=1931992 RepID=A0A4D4IZK1_9PSEU|nr:SDR family oxidoreductase [Gandjariella thermophila]GDY28534.1 nucleotide-diphosphate-sugar epimerase [Gandjariella thermophila]
MDQPILVTGGTGALGRVVVDRLLGGGHEVRVMSRGAAPAEQPPGRGWATADLLTGAGVDAALRGVGVVVHCATSASGPKEIRAMRTLVDAARGAGCAHLVYVSIVGVDRVPLAYYRGKLAAEGILDGCGVPSTVLRATQFHDLLRVLFAMAARLPVMPVPDLPFQPVDAGEVAARLVELAAGEPAGRVPDMGGPEVRDAVELARAYLAATGRRRPVVPVRLPGRTFRAYRRGGHLAPDHAVGRRTFEQYLAEHPDPAGTSYRGR